MTFLGIEVNRLSGKSASTADYQQLADAQEFELTSRDSNDAPLHLLHGTEAEPETGVSPAAHGCSGTGELSGIYFGILNIFTTLPQFVGTFISSIVFTILDPGRSPELTDGGGGEGDAETPKTDGGPNAIAVCLFIGAMSSLVAVYVTRRLRYL